MSRIIGTMTTFPLRSDIVERAVSSMAGQVDELNVVFNEYQKFPDWTEKYPTINPILPEFDTKDTGKYLISVSAEDWLFTLDDDIIYPDNYVEFSISSLKKLGVERSVGGYHGSNYRKPRFLPSSRALRRLLGVNLNYIVNSRNDYLFEKGLTEAIMVEQLGTGTTFSLGSNVPTFDFVRDAQRFIDVRVARWCYENDRRMVCLGRPDNWLRQSIPQENTSIFQTFTLRAPAHVAVEIEQFAFRCEGTGRPLVTSGQPLIHD